MKRFLTLLLLITSIGWANFAAAKPKAVIYDTDMAFDDWLALLYLAKHSNVDLLAITRNIHRQA